MWKKLTHRVTDKKRNRRIRLDSVLFFLPAIVLYNNHTENRWYMSIPDIWRDLEMGLDSSVNGKSRRAEALNRFVV